MSANPGPSQPPAPALAGQPLPVVRIPMLDQDRQLFAYELVFQLGATDTAELMHRLLATLTDGTLSGLVRGSRTFLNLTREILLEQTDVLLHQPRFGVIVQPQAADDLELLDRLRQLAQRGCLLLLDAGDSPLHGSARLEALLQMVQFVRLDASRLEPDDLLERSQRLHERGIWVIAGQVDDHATYQRCLALPLHAIQGRYLFLPEKVDVPVLTANRLSILRLMRTLTENNPGPVELGEIIRDDAVLSFKLLSCVNSAYFALPRQFKSVQQAAIYFGVTRMRNWIYTMALGGMDDRPPELLRAALIRAQMCERLAEADGLPRDRRELAFTVGLFSLLDTLMCVPMETILEQLPLAREIVEALVEKRGPYAALLDQVHAWECGMLSGQTPQRIQRLASIYLESTQWADQVYAHADVQPH
ncbi:EAL and HDOD domain-containing protein [Aerosticca soli]|nr:HDOD domain-containing protein [Aerosticca soli]